MRPEDFILCEDSAKTHGFSFLLTGLTARVGQGVCMCVCARASRTLKATCNLVGPGRFKGLWSRRNSWMLPARMLLQSVLLHKAARAVWALERALPRVHTAVLGQLSRVPEAAWAQRTAMRPPTARPVDGMVPCQVAGPLERLPTRVTLKGLHF